MRSRDTLAPHESLQSVETAAGRVVGVVAVIAALSSGLGLLSATELSDAGWGWAIPTTVLAAISVAVAIWATIPKLDEVRPGDLEDVDRFFSAQIKFRGRLVRFAACGIAAALVLTPLPLFASAVGGEGSPQVGLSLESRGSYYEISAEGTSLEADSLLKVTVNAGAPHAVAMGMVNDTGSLRLVGRVSRDRVLRSHDVQAVVSLDGRVIEEQSITVAP